jgi:hypothetical protein
VKKVDRRIEKMRAINNMSIVSPGIKMKIIYKLLTLSFKCYFFFNGKYIINNKTYLCTRRTEIGKRETINKGAVYKQITNKNRINRSLPPAKYVSFVLPHCKNFI